MPNPGLVERDEAVLEDGPVMKHHFIEPSALSHDGFASDIIADRGGPLRLGQRMQHAAGVVVAIGSPNTSAISAIRLVSRNPPVLRRSG